MILLTTSLIAVMILASVLRGAPYVPTHARQVEIALDLLELKPGDRLVDVGSGDGKILVAGANRGLRVTGYEINPILCAISWLRIRRHKSKASIVWGDIWGRALPADTKGVFVFTMGKYMQKLEDKIKDQGLENVRMASHGFELPSRKPIKTKEAIFLYEID